MATRRVEIGLTGETVRANIKRLRRGMTLRDLSDHMAKVVRPMAHNTISEIERGARRCDVDDLMALSEALGVSPLALLMPETHTRDDLVQATGRPLERAEVLWKQGLRGELPDFGDTTEPTLEGTADYRRFVRSTPPWEIEEALGKVSRGND
jgi:transcriptional regulator with XRE-family HTH domain